MALVVLLWALRGCLAAFVRWAEPLDSPTTPQSNRLVQLATAPRASLCRGFPLHGQHFFNATLWDMLREHDTAQAWMFTHREYFMDEFYAQATSFIIPHLEAAVRDCAGGVVTALANGLPFFSRFLGDEAAFRYFTVAAAILHQLRKQMALQSHALNVSWGGGWQLLRHREGTMFAPNFPAMPEFFGMRSRSCGPGAPRLHVLRDVARTEHAVRCSTGLRAAEVWFHRQLLHSDCGWADIEDADFVFVPLYSVCQHMLRHQWSPLHMHAPLVRPYYELSEDTSDLLQELGARFGPNFEERLLLFFPEEKWPLFGAGLSTRPGPHRLVVEARPLHCTHYDRVRVETLNDDRVRCFHCHDCFRPGYDIVVPSFVDFYLRAQLLEANRPYDDRPLLIVHHGAGGEGSSDGIYTEVLNWRAALNGLRHLPNVSVGGHSDDYIGLLGRGRFCLVPKGVGYWTHRLYEAILAGCVPVILSDHSVLPYQGVAGIDWIDFSVKWPEERIGPELYEWLSQLDMSRRAAALKTALDRVACWFDYHGTGDCSALAATLHALTQASTPAAATSRGAQPRFWNTPDFPDRRPEEQYMLWLQWRREYNLSAQEAAEAMREAGAVFGGSMS